MSYLGDLVLASDIEQGVIEHYQKWETTYLAEVERLKGLDVRSLPTMRSFTTRNELDKFPEEQIPSMVVVSPGVEPDSIERTGEGHHSALWDLGVAVVCSSSDSEATSLLRGAYGAVVRGVFVQHPELPIGRVEDWIDESYNDLPVEAGRTLAVVQLIFRVRVEQTVEAQAGLVEPLADPYDSYELPTATDVEADVQKVGA